MTLNIPLLISSITVILLASCSSKLNVEKVPGEGTCTTDCPQITNLNPPAAQGGDQVTMEGENFYPGMTITIDGQVITPDVISATEASFTMPDSSPGSKAVLVTGNSDDSAFTAYQVADDGVPMITASADLICQGTQFYNAAGELTSGTANCSAAPSDCSADGQTGCVTTAAVKAVVVSGLATKIVSGNTVAGVAGTFTYPAIAHVSNGVQYGAGGTEFTGTGAGPSACTSDGQTACVADASFPAADASLAVAGNIKSGVTIAGTAGDYPSSTYPLPSASFTADLDNVTFNAKIKSATAFEYWTSAGAYQTGAGDADITAANIVSGTSIFGTAGSASAGGGPTCTSDGETGCTTDATFKAVDTSAITEWDIKTGKTVGGISGSVKTNCRNAINSTVYNYDGDTSFIGTNGVTNGTQLDWWDTIDNYNNSLSVLPTDQPAGWSTDNLCGKELWSDVTGGDGCNTAADDCMMKDNVTGLTWSESYPVTATKPDNIWLAWDHAIDHCNDLNFGSITTWRLPTLMELMDAYNHGIRQIGYSGGGAWTSGDTKENNDFFIASEGLYWSATTVSDYTVTAYRVHLGRGESLITNKTQTSPMVCVSP